ncbi:MAG: hypothetical protein IKI57_01985 [Clostridia bacterium]|nr:hypothetical protein [Clostridia bacterium]
MEEEIDLYDLLMNFWKKKLWLIVAILIGIIAAFIYTALIITPKYTSSITLILSKPENTTSFTTNDAITQSDITLNQKLISTYGEILKSRRVGNAVINKLNLDMTYNELKEGVSVSSVKDTDVIKVSVTTDNAKKSQDIVTEMIEVFTEEVDRIYSIKNVSIIDEAELNKVPVNVSYVKNIIIFSLVALVIAGGIIFMIYYFDNSITTIETVTQLTDLPVLACIPKTNGLDDKKKGGKQ